MAAIPQSSQDVVLIGQPTGPRGFPGPSAPTFASIAEVRAAALTGVPTIFVSGYYGVGTFGGGFFTQVPGAGADNGGSIIHDANQSPFVRVDITGSVTEWGAKCDAVFVTTPGTGIQGQNTFTTSASIPLTAIGNPIAIAGAGAAGGTLSGHILGLSVSGPTTTVTLDVTIGTSFPLYVASDLTAITNGGNGLYAIGDTCVMSDGTTVIVNAIHATLVTSVTPSVQAAPQFPMPGTVSQVSSSGLGLGLTCTLKYAASGQFAYGSDDHAAINSALSNAVTDGINVYIPQGMICAITQPVVLPAGAVYLNGADMWKTGLVCLAPMAYGLYRPPGGRGGGGSNMFVDGMKLATSAVEDGGSSFVNWTFVQARNGLVQDWLGDSLVGHYFINCDGRTITSMFGTASLLSQYNFNIVGPSGSRFVGCTADACSQANFFAQGAGAYVEYCDFFGGSCYAYDPVYGFDLRGSQQSLIGNQVGSPKTASVRIAGSGIICIGTVCQWGLSGYADPVNTYGIYIEPTGSPFFTGNDLVVGNTTDGSLSAANIVFQNGTSATTTLVQSNAGATYVYPPAIVPASNIVWAQPTTNSLANAAVAAGGAPMGQYLFGNYDALFRAIGTSRLALMDGLYFLATEDEITALFNLANPNGSKLVKHGGLTFTAFRGYTGDGTSGYLDTQLQTNLLTKFTLNSGSIAVWTGSPSVSADNSYSIGSTTGGRDRINPRQANGNMSSRSQNSTTDIVASSADSIGSFAWSRYGSATPPGYTQYIDGLPVAHPVSPATTIFGGTFTLLADGTAGTPQYSTRPIAAAMIGTGFSDADMLAIDQAVKNMLLAANNAPT